MRLTGGAALAVAVLLGFAFPGAPAQSAPAGIAQLVPARQVEPEEDTLSLEVIQPEPPAEEAASVQQLSESEEAAQLELPAEEATSTQPPSEPEIDAAGEDVLSVPRPEGTSRGGSRPTPMGVTGETGGSAGERIAGVALQYLGFPYVWGGSSPRSGFDCSGLTWYVYSEAKVSLPARYLGDQLNAGPRIDIDQLLPGDLVFFRDTYQEGLSHAGIYLGDDRFIHAVAEGEGVSISNLRGDWGAHFMSGTRPWAGN